MPPGKSSPRWQVEGFEEAFDRWVGQESPDHDLRMLVLNWMFTRQETPYKGMQRERNFPNLWYGHVPRSHHGDDLVVVCSMWVEEATHTVRCDLIASLSWPIE